MVDAVCVPPGQIDQFLPFAVDHIQAASSECGDWRPEEIICGLKEARMLLWFAIDNGKVLASAVTRVSIIGGDKVCAILLCAGRDLRRWADLRYAIEKYAKREECRKMRVEGRKGWARVFTDYHQPYITLEKVL